MELPANTVSIGSYLRTNKNTPSSLPLQPPVVEGSAAEKPLSDEEVLKQMSKEINERIDDTVRKIVQLQFDINTPDKVGIQKCSNFSSKERNFIVDTNSVVVTTRYIFERFEKYTTLRLDSIQSSKRDNFFKNNDYYSKFEKLSDDEIRAITVVNLLEMSASNLQLGDFVECFNKLTMLVDNLLDLFENLYSCSSDWGKEGQAVAKDLYLFLDSLEHHASYIITLYKLYNYYSDKGEENKTLIKGKEWNSEDKKKNRSFTAKQVWFETRKFEKKNPSPNPPPVRRSPDPPLESRTSACVIS